MKCVLVSLVSIFVAASIAWDGNGGLRVRFGITNIGVDYFVELPRSVSAAISQSWTQASRANDVLPSLSLYCHDSYIVCVLFDDTDYVAGIQVAFPDDEVTDTIYDWKVQGFSKWTPTDNNTYWAIQQYFVNEDFLSTSADKRVASRNPSKTLQAGGVWVSGINGELVEMSDNTDGILANGFTKQACIPFMGNHYYRYMTTELQCNEELFPWFALTDNDQELIATGLIVYGKYAETDGDWYERPSSSEVQMIVPNGPDCLYNLADSPGLITMHIYYIDTPWTFFC